SPRESLAVLFSRIRGGDCAVALPSLDRLTAAFPDIAKAHYLTGFCRAQTGATEPAAPLSAEGPRRHAERALAALSKVQQLQPKFPGAALLEGQVLARAGKPAEAEASMKREIANA